MLDVEIIHLIMAANNKVERIKTLEKMRRNPQPTGGQIAVTHLGTRIADKRKMHHHRQVIAGPECHPKGRITLLTGVAGAHLR